MNVLGGPERCIFYEIVGINAPRVHSMAICVIIFQHTGRIFIRYYALYIYVIVWIVVAVVEEGISHRYKINIVFFIDTSQFTLTILISYL